MRTSRTEAPTARRSLRTSLSLLPPRAARSARRTSRRLEGAAGHDGLPEPADGDVPSARVEIRQDSGGGPELSEALLHRHDRAHQPAQQGADQEPMTWRRYLYKTMNGRSTITSAAVFKTFLSVVIVGNLCIYMLSTMPSLAGKYVDFFDYEEAAVSFLFLLEYVIRLWTIGESHKYNGWMGRLKYMCTWSSTCDALATFPFFVQEAISWGIPDAKLPNTTVLRMFSMFRVLKTERYLSAFESVGRVLYLNREILATSTIFTMLLVIMTATALYYADVSEPEPKQFPSIPATLYVALAMLTGTGSPEGPIDTLPLRLVCGFSSVFSVAVCAIPAAMLAWGFEAEAERRIAERREVSRQKKKAEEAGVAYEEPTTSESSQSSWEEFDSDADEIEQIEELQLEVTAVRQGLAEVTTAMQVLIQDVKELKTHLIKQ